MGKGKPLEGIKLISRRLVAVGTAFVLAVTLPVQVYGDNQTDLQNAENAKTAIDQKLKEVQNQLNELSKNKSDIESYIKQIDANIASIDNDISSLTEQIANKEDEIEQAQEYLEETQALSDAQYESMKLRIKYMYENGQGVSNYLAILMESESMPDVLNKAEYIMKINKYDRQMLDEYAELARQITETKALLEDDLEALENMKVEVEAQRQALELVQTTKNQELASLTSTQADQKAYYAQLEKEKAEQESAIKAIEEKIRKEEEEARKKAEEAAKNGQTSTVTVQTYDGGMFKWPTTSTRITSPYGDTEDRSSAHQGVDIGAVSPGVAGDAIYAAYDGTVSWAYYSSSAGNWIGINHGDGVISVYMHCSKILVTEGQKVKKGDTIALMGQTGNAYGVHLHFAVRVNGSYVNPMKYFGK